MDDRYALSTYRYHLPDDRIAQTASHPPESAKMLSFLREADDSSNGSDFQDFRFSDLPGLALDGRLFFFNDTRVIPSRVAFSSASFTNKDGFRREKEGEIFFLRELGHGEDPSPQYAPRFEALVFPGAAFSVGSRIELGNFVLEVESKIPDGRVLKIVSGGSIHDFLHSHGKLPLPPYVEYSDEKASDYQTEFGKKEGSLAAPTASLHFTESLISKLRENGSSARFLTLHVGLGTFKPVRVADIREHEMHPEYFEVPASAFSDVATAKAEGKKVVGVGTTVIRTLESLPYVWRELSHRAEDGDSDAVAFLSKFDSGVSSFWKTAAGSLDPDYRPEELLSVNSSGVS